MAEHLEKKRKKKKKKKKGYHRGHEGRSRRIIPRFGAFKNGDYTWVSNRWIVSDLATLSLIVYVVGYSRGERFGKERQRGSETTSVRLLVLIGPYKIIPILTPRKQKQQTFYIVTLFNIHLNTQKTQHLLPNIAPSLNQEHAHTIYLRTSTPYPQKAIPPLTQLLSLNPNTPLKNPWHSFTTHPARLLLRLTPKKSSLNSKVKTYLTAANRRRSPSNIRAKEN